MSARGGSSSNSRDGPSRGTRGGGSTNGRGSWNNSRGGRGRGDRGGGSRGGRGNRNNGGGGRGSWDNSGRGAGVRKSGGRGGGYAPLPLPGPPPSASMQRAAADSASSVQFIRSVLRRSANHQLEQLIGSAERKWLQCWESVGALPPDTVRTLLSALARLPFSASVKPPPLSSVAQGVTTLLQKRGNPHSGATDGALDGNDTDLEDVELVERLVKRLLKFTWDLQAEDVKAKLVDMIGSAIKSLTMSLPKHLSILPRLTSLIEELEKSWAIKMRASTTSNTRANSGSSIDSAEQDWREPTVGWLANYKHFQPLLLPKMRAAQETNGRVFASPEEYFSTILKLWVGMTFVEGNNALLPHCTAKSQDKICDQPLWPLPRSNHSIACRNPQCGRPATFVCANRYHHIGYCSRCASQLQQRLRGPPSNRASTHIYDSTIANVRHDGTIALEHVKSRRPPLKEIHWRTTKRLASPNLVGIVPVASREASLRENDKVYWGQIVFQGQSFDEFKARERGRMTFRLLEYRDEPGNPMMANSPRQGDAVVVIDCQTFVPEFIPVLKALEMQSRMPVPFKNGAMLNLCADADGYNIDNQPPSISEDGSDVSDDPVNIHDMTSRYDSTEELVRQMIHMSTLAPIIDICRDSVLRDRLQRSLLSLVRSATLDRGQLTSFVEALLYPVHCTQGPPGTGKSYLGVVIVRALLVIRDLWKKKSQEIGDPPILVLSYKNHAIDEFLLDLLHSEPALNHNQMHFRRYGSGVFQRLIRIGGGCNEQELAPYAERNTAYNDPAVRAISSEIDAGEKLVEEWQQLRNNFLPILESHSELFPLSGASLITSELRKSIMKVVPTVSTTVATLMGIRALVRRCKDVKEASDSDDDASSSGDDSESVSVQEEPVNQLQDLLDDPRSLTNDDFKALFNGIRHYDSSIDALEVLYQWLIGFHPLPPCSLDGCLAVCREGYHFCHDHACAYTIDSAICGDEVLKGCRFCAVHNCSSGLQCQAAKMLESRFCVEHSCKFALEKRLCCEETARKRMYCQSHLCSAEKCKQPKIDVMQSFCSEHACFWCLRDEKVALLAVDEPPRNACEVHPLCWGMNGMEMCLQLAIPGQSYCADHEEVLYCKWKTGSQKCAEIATEGQYCQEHHLLVVSKSQKKMHSVDSTHCVALTKKGRQCRGNKLPGRDVCADHIGKSWSRVANSTPLKDPVPATSLAPPLPARQSTLGQKPAFVRSDVFETLPAGNTPDEPHSAGIQPTDISSRFQDGKVDESGPGTADEAAPSCENELNEEKTDSNDEVWSWSSNDETDFAVDGAHYDNTDEVEESDHLQHLREVYEVEEAEASSSESESEEGNESEEKAQVPVDEMRHEIVLPGDWDWEMTLPDRWRAILGVLNSWVDSNECVQMLLKEDIKILKHSLHQETLRASARVYEGKSIIGGTITGCVARLEAIRMTNPFAVLVEEASEVMEPLLFSCFSSSTVKLEMIGDHLQLQPSVMNRIDFERINKINISMFERLICAPPGSAAPSSVLSIQRRMRKNICDLTREFYKDITTIEDHAVCRTKVINDGNKKLPLLRECASQGREIPGVLPHVFFWTHRGAEQRATVGLSRINPAEAHMTCSLAKYLVHCGVPPKSIAVLTPYKGQLMLIRKLLMTMYKLVAHVKDRGGQRTVPACTVSTVDRFQGDEADVVLISLVIDGKSRTPFVKLQNRMIVLLSRARLGMYIIGNRDYFWETRHWQLALETLENGADSDNDDAKTGCEVFRGRRIGEALPICCPVHRDSTASASSDKDLKLGFCSVVCTEALKCSHLCGKKCHYPHLGKHNERCTTMVASPCLRHPEQLMCERVTSATNLFPIGMALTRYPCPVKMEVTQPCGHSIQMQCNDYRSIEENRTGWPPCSLPAIAPFVYPVCKHALDCSCANFERYTNGNAPPCTEMGEYTPPCQHLVTLPCHVRQDHEAGTRVYACKKKVTVDLPRCSHSVTVSCPIAMEFANWTGSPCLTRGTVSEGLAYGPKDYSCKQPARFVRKCGHVERVTCERAFELSANPTRCLEEVTIVNPECGHECKVKCFERDTIGVGGTASGLIASAVTSFLSATGATPVSTPATAISIVKEKSLSNYFDYGLKLQCSKEVTLERVCGHTERMKCSDARRLTTQCTEVVTKKLPSCGHSVQLPCNLLHHLHQWQPWGEPDNLDTSQRQAIERLQMDNVMADDCPVPYALPPQVKQHLRACRAPVRFWRRTTCDHEIELKCDTAFRVLEGSEKLPKCTVRVQKALDCGHTTVVDCFKQSETQQCDQVVELPCWNSGLCGNSVKAKCSMKGRVVCAKKTQWTCDNGHSFTLALCTKGTPSSCPNCSKSSLSKSIATLKTWQEHPPEHLDSMASDSQLFANVKGVTPVKVTRENQQLFLGRKLKLLARFQSKLDPTKPWKQVRFDPQNVLCFFKLDKKKKTSVHLEKFDPCLFSSSSSMMGMEMYEATPENIDRICAVDKSSTIVVVRLCTLQVLFNPTGVPHMKGQKQKFHASMQSWVANQQKHGFDCVYRTVGSRAGGTLTVWQPFALYPTHCVELTPANRSVFASQLPTTTQLRSPTYFTLTLPAELANDNKAEKTAEITKEVMLSDEDRDLLQRYAGLLSPLYEKLDLQYPWEGKELVIGGVQVPPKVEKMLASKLNFVPVDVAGGSSSTTRKPLGGINCLKNVVKNTPLADADLFFALELLVVRKQEASEARDRLEAYIKSCVTSEAPAHPLVILAIVRLDSHKGTEKSSREIERKLLELFCRLYPDAIAHWLTAPEKNLVGVGTASAAGTTVGSSASHGAGFSSIEDKWHTMKEEHGCRSDAMDSLLKLVGLRKVKVDAVSLFKKAIAFQWMPAAKRKKNVMAFNYCFLGNPGTGKTTVARLFAQILQDSGVRPDNTFVECTAQKLKDDGAYTFRQKIQQATGGVLFIDEAYELDPVGDSKGKPIVAELLTAAEDKRGELSIILAGYEDDIQKKLYAYNDGLSSRFTDITFEDFDAKELETVWNGLAEERGWEFEAQSATVACRRLAKASGRKGFGNARAVRKLFEKAVKAAMARDDFDGDMTFTTGDLVGERPSRNPKLRAVLDEVNERIGWGRIKEELERLVRISDENYVRELQGIDTVPVPLSRLFLGNPGTGKTTCASYYGRVLKALEFLSNGEVVKKTAGDFIGGYVGQSQTKTAQILDMARGKVLVIDEAYNLNGDLYGKQVLDVLVEKVQGTESDDIAVVLIGYEHEMTEMLRTQNPGLRRRFPPEYAFHFDDYSEHELLEILEWNCAKKSVVCPLDVAEVMLAELSKQKTQANFGNAGAVEQLLKHAMASAVGRPIVDGMTALTLVDVGGSEKPEEERRDPLDALKSLYRVDNIREKLVRLRNEMRVAQQEGSDLPEVGHFVFRGSPGTGKTTVARVMAQVLHEMGALATNKLVESSGLTLTGEYVGQTKTKVTEQLGQARGGVLLIDEAYELGKGMYGEEAMTTLVAALTDPTYGGLVVVMAGYPADMDMMLNRNAGLKSRFTRYIDFEDWTAQDAVVFVCGKADKENFEVMPEAIEVLRRTFMALKALEGFGNGRDADRMWKELLQCRAQRVVTAEEFEPTITKEDAEEASGIILSDRRPPSVPLLSQSSSSLFDSSTFQLDETSATNRVARAGESPVTQEELIRRDDDDREVLDNEHDDSEGEEPQEDAQRDPGVSDEVWAELERAKKEHAAHLNKLKQLRDAAAREEERRKAQDKLDEERRKAAAIQERIRQICPCPAGYTWYKAGSGWRCGGGSHFVSDAQLERQFTL